ncbi:hypothetical protein HS088_TW21G01298 [Tripterygium wilfordii]|uniref:LOB domain-containing protein n=1 Tax=Tripterygium wilfordii TaxID=458696 RepID=A0A7J7C4R3_TRIWF|nr:hypothetical protein HS088_TW21G01298 [Tripterygium wilfordii]
MTKRNNEESNPHACAACKHQRKRCTKYCVLRPYLPMEKNAKFQAAHGVFGVSNMSKMLKRFDDSQSRDIIIKSIFWEADAWEEDPIRGPLGRFEELEKKYQNLLREKEWYRNTLYNVQQISNQGSNLGTIGVNHGSTNDVRVAANGFGPSMHAENAGFYDNPYYYGQHGYNNQTGSQRPQGNFVARGHVNGPPANFGYGDYGQGNFDGTTMQRVTQIHDPNFSMNPNKQMIQPYSNNNPRFFFH